METQQAERILPLGEARDKRAEGRGILVRHRQAQRHEDQHKHQSLDCRESNGCGQAQAVERRNEAGSVEHSADKRAAVVELLLEVIPGQNHARTGSAHRRHQRNGKTVANIGGRRKDLGSSGAGRLLLDGSTQFRLDGAARLEAVCNRHDCRTGSHAQGRNQVQEVGPRAERKIPRDAAGGRRCITILRGSHNLYNATTRRHDAALQPRSPNTHAHTHTCGPAFSSPPAAWSAGAAAIAAASNWARCRAAAPCTTTTLHINAAAKRDDAQPGHNAHPTPG